MEGFFFPLAVLSITGKVGQVGNPEHSFEWSMQAVSRQLPGLISNYTQLNALLGFNYDSITFLQVQLAGIKMICFAGSVKTDTDNFRHILAPFAKRAINYRPVSQNWH